MDWTVFVCVVIVSVLPLHGSPHRGRNTNQLLQLLKRRNFMRPHDTILRVPQYPEDLPPAEPILPGHTLLRPSNSMLRSAIKYPLRDLGGAAVYGNLDNLGITYGKTRDRIRYTNFRKSNLKRSLHSLLENLRSLKPGSLIVIEIDPAKLPSSIASGQNRINRYVGGQDTEEDNNGSEILDNPDEVFDDSNQEIDFRRRKSDSKFRNRYKYYRYGNHGNKLEDFEKFSKGYMRLKHKLKNGQNGNGQESSESSDTDDGKKRDYSSTDSSIESSSIERNPGNPFTVHKNKYKQNWLWNHFMDGDHMNINPLAPKLGSPGPSGADLFFGRKWWYFNQDDYKPLR